MTSSAVSAKQGRSRGRAPARETTQGAVDELRLKQLLDGLVAMRDGNFRKRLPVAGDDVTAELATVFNEIAERQQHLASELNRVHRVAGREGRYSERIDPGIGEGSWAKCADAANGLIADLVRPTGELARVVAAVS